MAGLNRKIGCEVVIATLQERERELERGQHGTPEAYCEAGGVLKELVLKIMAWIGVAVTTKAWHRERTARRDQTVANHYHR